MGILMSSIHPDRELRDFLADKIMAGKTAVTVYSDWERPTNKLPDDFIVVYMNGNISGPGTKTNYAEGALSISLYCKLNSDGSIKGNRIDKILSQFESLVDRKVTENYFFYYEADRYITPPTPNQTSGYSIVTLNLMWHTTKNFNSQ